MAVVDAVDVRQIQKHLPSQSIDRMRMNRESSGHFASKELFQSIGRISMHIGDDRFGPRAVRCRRSDLLSDQRIDEAAFADVFPANQPDEITVLAVAACRLSE